MAQAQRDTVPFDIDGVVFKVNDILEHNRLGNLSNRPRWAISAKFPAQEAFTKLTDVVFQVGQTGVTGPGGVSATCRSWRGERDALYAA